MAADGAHEPLVSAWLAVDLLKNRGSSAAKLVGATSKKICRADVVENKDVLMPVIEHLGMKPNIDVIHESVRSFLWKTRPRGKPELTSALTANSVPESVPVCVCVCVSDFKSPFLSYIPPKTNLKRGSRI